MTRTLEEILRVRQDEELYKRTKKNHPKGWEPCVIETGDTAKAISQPLETATPDEEELIRGWNLNPEEWEIVGDVNCRRWQTYDERWLHYYKADLRRRKTKVDISDLISTIKRRKPLKLKESSEVGDCSFVICPTDFQIGKGDVDGSAGRLERTLTSIDNSVLRYKQLVKLGRKFDAVYIMLLGDLIENCFAGETRVITSTGIKPINELAKTGKATVLTEEGKWVDAEVKSFGMQPLMKLTLDRNGTSKEVFVTPKHKWKRDMRPYTNDGMEWCETLDLRPGDVLPSVFGSNKALKLDRIGVMHGIVFGDGFKKSSQMSEVSFYSDEKKTLLNYFTEYKKKTGNRGETVVTGLPAWMKDKPLLEWGPRYLLSWLAGYVATDGCSTGHPGASLSISSANRSNLEFVQEVASICGIGTRGINSSVRPFVEIGGNMYIDHEMFSVDFVPSTIPEVLLIRKDQKDDLADRPSSRDSNKRAQKSRKWQVVKVEPTDRFEEVFCAVVPGKHTFCLEGNLLTGNCSGHYEMQRFTSDLNLRDQQKVVRQIVYYLLDSFAPLNSKIVVSSCPGNHGEALRFNGKAATDFNDNIDVAVVEQVMEAVSYNPDRYGHVSFVFPSKDDLSVGLDISGVPCGFIHGHQAKSGSGGPAGKIMNWWKNQAHGETDIGATKILFVGHYHHHYMVNDGAKTLIGCTATDGFSDWWRLQSGQTSQAGITTLTVGSGVSQSGWCDLQIC